MSFSSESCCFFISLSSSHLPALSIYFANANRRHAFSSPTQIIALNVTMLTSYQRNEPFYAIEVLLNSTALAPLLYQTRICEGIIWVCTQFNRTDQVGGVFNLPSWICTRKVWRTHSISWRILIVRHCRDAIRLTILQEIYSLLRCGKSAFASNFKYHITILRPLNVERQHNPRGIFCEQRQCDVVTLNSLNHFVPAAKRSMYQILLYYKENANHPSHTPPS